MWNGGGIVEICVNVDSCFVVGWRNLDAPVLIAAVCGSYMFKLIIFIFFSNLSKCINLL